jgi:SAM-dependent methyltransferase
VPLDIERIEQRNDLLSFFDHIKKTWTQLGDTEPHWSVLSLDAFKHEQLASNIEAFYESGKPEVDALCDMLNARSISINYDGVCLEYGGGLGRVTKWFAQKFSEVVSCDISSSHIKLAKEYLLSQGIENVALLQMSSIEDIENLPPADFIYSVIVLQHNPPPIIELILNNLLKSLKPGGYCLFQVPVYCANYTFYVDQYLNSVCNKSSTLNIEMHVLPREIVFEITYAQKCMLVDVFEDDWAGQGYVSNTFIVRKPVSQDV